jgi:hypothetical protein
MDFLPLKDELTGEFDSPYPLIRVLDRDDVKKVFISWFEAECSMWRKECMKPGWFSTNTAADCDKLVVCASSAPMRMPGLGIDEVFDLLSDPDPNKDNPCEFSEKILKEKDGYERASKKQNGVNLFRYIEETDKKLKCPSHLRTMENFQFPLYSVDNIKQTEGGKPALMYFEMIFSTREFVSQEGIWNMWTTGLVVVVLIAGGMLISRDANNLVLRPIERMIAMMQQIRRNPLVATQLGMEQDKSVKEPTSARPTIALKKKLGEQSAIVQWWNRRAERKKAAIEDSAPMETVILEKTLIKFGSTE